MRPSNRPVGVLGLVVAAACGAQEGNISTRAFNAIARGDLPAARELYDAGADINYAPEGAPILYPVACNRKIGDEVLDFILGFPSLDVDKRDTTSGNTALHCTARAGLEERVIKLLARGASSSLENKKGKTAADLALEDGHEQVAMILKNHQKKKRT